MKNTIYLILTLSSIAVAVFLSELNKQKEINNFIYSKVEYIENKKTTMDKNILDLMEIYVNNVNSELKTKKLDDLGVVFYEIKGKNNISLKKDMRWVLKGKPIMYKELKTETGYIKIGIPEDYYFNSIKPGLIVNQEISKTPFKINSNNVEINIFITSMNKQIKLIESTKKIESIKKEALTKELLSLMIILGMYIIYKITLNRKEELKEEVDKKTKELEDLNKNLEKRVKEEIKRVKEIEQQLRQTEKVSSMGEMIGNIAHQWRQPLTSISTIASSLLVLIEHDMLETDELDKELDKIIKQTEYLSETINDFRDFIKPDETHKEDFDLKEAVEKALVLTESSIKNNYIDLEIDMEEIECHGLKNYITQCVVNMINNSKDAFNAKEIVDRKIKILVKKGERKNYIIIEDNAGGIPEDIISKVFEPYFTTKHKAQGTGLGLNMVFNLIKKYFKGDVRVKNTEKGARFTIEIPRKED